MMEAPKQHRCQQSAEQVSQQAKKRGKPHFLKRLKDARTRVYNLAKKAISDSHAKNKLPTTRVRQARNEPNEDADKNTAQAGDSNQHISPIERKLLGTRTDVPDQSEGRSQRAINAHNRNRRKCGGVDSVLDAPQQTRKHYEIGRLAKIGKTLPEQHPARVAGQGTRTNTFKGFPQARQAPTDFAYGLPRPPVPHRQ